MNRTTQPSISLLGIAVWLLAAIFFLYEFFLRVFLGSVGQQVITDLHLTAGTFGLVGVAYYIAYAGMQIPAGILVDTFGVKRIMVLAVLMCAASAVLFANATGFTSAFLSRGLMGLGSSFAFICLLVIVATWFQREYFGFIAGISQFIGTLGPMLAAGPLIGILAKSHTTWRTAQSASGVFGVILAVFMLFIVKNKPHGGSRTLIFLKQPVEWRSQLAKLARNSQAWYIAFYSASTYVSLSLLGAIWGTIYLQARGLSQPAAAGIISLAWLGYALGCMCMGGISDLTRRRKPVLIFSSLMGVISTSCIVYYPIHSNLVYGVLFFGLGLASSGQNVGFATISEHVDFSTKATALGLNNGMIVFFGVIIPLIASYLINQSAGAAAGGVLHPANFTGGLTVMPVLYTISLIMSCFFIKETYCKPQKEAIILDRVKLSTA